jgi:hypothetical protein
MFPWDKRKKVLSALVAFTVVGAAHAIIGAPTDDAAGKAGSKAAPETAAPDTAGQNSDDAEPKRSKKPAKPSSVQVSIAFPVAEAKLKGFSEARGSAKDNSGGTLKSVDLYLQRREDNRFWNGKSWGAPSAVKASFKDGNWTAKDALPSAKDMAEGRYRLMAVARTDKGKSGMTSAEFVLGEEKPKAPAKTDVTTDKTATSTVENNADAHTADAKKEGN